MQFLLDFCCLLVSYWPLGGLRVFADASSPVFCKFHLARKLRVGGRVVSAMLGLAKLYRLEVSRLLSDAVETHKL